MPDTSEELEQPISSNRSEQTEQPRMRRSNLLKASLFVLSVLSSYIIYRYLNLSEVDRLLLLNFEKNAKWRNYLEKFRNQTLSYQECDPNVTGQTCECFKQQISLDLAIWKNVKLDGQLLSSTKKLAVHYQIIDNKLYREKSCPFTPRCKGVEHFLLRALKQRTFKNVDLLINVHDWPTAYDNHKRALIPGVSFSKDADLFKDIIYPAWSFFAGGPAINSHPRGIGQWDKLKTKISGYANRSSFSAKKEVAFFRGSRTSEERDPIVLISRANSTLVDAKYTKNQAWRSPKDTLGERPADEVSFEKHCDYRYLINLRGVAASFRYRHLFLCRSVVLNVKSRWIEFFYRALRPWYHYVPLDEEAKNLLSIVKFLGNYPQIAERIAENGFEFVSKHLTEDSALCYWIELLTRYQSLITYKVKPEKDYILVK